jgi:energy-coupling factor transporter ATP-binding protein EcfA2
MDEPTRSVDAAHADDVWRLVRTEIESVEGCVVLVTHQFEEALAQSARIAVLADGRIGLDSRTDRLGSLAVGLDGFTLSVRGLAPCDLAALARFPGVRDIRVASQLVAGEQTLEVWTHESDLPLAGFLGQLTLSGATICSLQRSPPLHGILERLTAATATCGGREAVTA